MDRIARGVGQPRRADAKRLQEYEIGWDDNPAVLHGIVVSLPKSWHYLANSQQNNCFMSILRRRWLPQLQSILRMQQMVAFRSRSISSCSKQQCLRSWSTSIFRKFRVEAMISQYIFLPAAASLKYVYLTYTIAQQQYYFGDLPVPTATF